MSELTHSFILPAYNESERLTTSIPKVLEYVHDRGLRAEIIVVNDGSTDSTAEVVRQFAVANPMIVLLENPGNRGKGYSVRHGMLHARGAVALFTDADLSSPITEADKLFAALANGADMAIGSRWLKRELQTEPQPILRQFTGGYLTLGCDCARPRISRHPMWVQSVYPEAIQTLSPGSGSNDGVSIPNCCILPES